MSVPVVRVSVLAPVAPKTVEVGTRVVLLTIGRRNLPVRMRNRRHLTGKQSDRHE